MGRHIVLSGGTLLTRLTWPPHINQVTIKAAQMMGVLCPLLNRSSGLSISNGVLLHKHITCPMMDYVCPIWRSLPAPTSGGCKCYSPSVLALLLVHPSIVAAGTHEYLGVPFFADHIRAITVSFDSKLANVGNPLVRQLGGHLH
jgi:hypothetical protein